MPAIRHLKLSRKYHPIKSNWLTSSLWPMISVGHSLLLQVLANEFTLFSLKQEFFLFLFLKSILHYIHFLNPQFINSPRATLKKKSYKSCVTCPLPPAQLQLHLQPLPFLLMHWKKSFLLWVPDMPYCVPDTHGREVNELLCPSAFSECLTKYMSCHFCV